MKKKPLLLLRRLEALLLAAGILWGVAVTAGSGSAASAWAALREAAPTGILRWELGDLWARDQLSPAAALAFNSSSVQKAKSSQKSKGRAARSAS